MEWTLDISENLLYCCFQIPKFDYNILDVNKDFSMWSTFSIQNIFMMTWSYSIIGGGGGGESPYQSLYGLKTYNLSNATNFHILTTHKLPYDAI